MKKVEAFQANDGKLFDSEGEATIHEEEQKFHEASRNGEVAPLESEPESTSDLWGWVISNSEFILSALCRISQAQAADRGNVKEEE